MNPQQQYTPGSGYDFIFNPPSPAGGRRLGLPGGGRSRLMVGAVGLGVLLLLIFIAYSLLGGKGFDATGPVSVAQTQQELVRVAAEAGPNTTQLATSSLAINAQLTVQTQQTKLLAYLSKQGKKVNAK